MLAGQSVPKNNKGSDSTHVVLKGLKGLGYAALKIQVRYLQDRFKIHLFQWLMLNRDLWRSNIKVVFFCIQRFFYNLDAIL